MDHPCGRRYPAPDVDFLEKYLGDYSVVVVGDPESKELDTLPWKFSPEKFGFLDARQRVVRAVLVLAVGICRRQ